MSRECLTEVEIKLFLFPYYLYQIIINSTPFIIVCTWFIASSFFHRKESRTITHASLIRSLSHACFGSLLSILNFVTFSTYTGLGNALTPRKVFTVIVLFSIMRLYFYNSLVLNALGVSEMWVSLKRIKVCNLPQSVFIIIMYILTFK